ncbi:helix-turn-helix transcriptional regulator [Herbiconiux sp. YIM B11900]|uniref:helix-turn-helix transcriptional regulator n=1 Tax=Herbiconiux sp. YIM B11900 TaxID=3404131 RepID=UPI003F82A480
MPERSAERARARDALLSGTGVVIVGERGSGRADFLHTVQQELDTATRGRLWIGQDLEVLDDERLARFVQAVGSGTILPLATMSVREAPRPAIDALLRRGEVIRIMLGPLSSRELVGVAERLLDGPLETGFLPSFIPARGGADIEALEEFLRHAAGSGQLTRTEGGWRIGATVPPSEPLRRLIHSRAARGSDIGELTATLLDVVALTPGVSLTSAERIVERLQIAGEVDEALERLEEAGMLEIVETAVEPRLRIRDGVVEVLLPQSIGVLRRRRLAAAIVEVLGELPATELSAGELVAFARLSLASGRTVPTRTLVQAATTSLRAPDSAVSLQLATAAVESGGGFEAEMALSAADAQAGNSAAARARLHRLVAAADGDAQVSGVITALTNHILVSTADHDALGELWSSAGPILHVSSPRANASKGFVLFALGDVIGAAELVRPALTQLAGEEYGEACFVLANSALLQGRLTEAESMLAASEAALSQAGADSSKVQVVRANVQFFQGRGTESLVVISAFRDGAAAAGMAAAQALCGWAVGIVMISQGRIAEAHAELRTSLAIMERLGLTGTARGVRSELATVLGIMGERATAMEVLASNAEAPPGNGSAGKILQARGWIDAGSGRPDEAVTNFVRAADAYAAQGLYLAQVSALTDAARAGGASTVLAKTHSLADLVEGPYAAIGVRLVRALADRQSPETAAAVRADDLAAEFDRIGEEAAAIDTHMIAAEAFSHAAELHHLAGASRDAAASARRRDEQARLCGSERLPFVRLQRPAVLSEREEELARLASSGLSNREIAEQLTLSVRTVETHLQRVYQKLGIRGRAELASAVQRDTAG